MTHVSMGGCTYVGRDTLAHMYIGQGLAPGVFLIPHFVYHQCLLLKLKSWFHSLARQLVSWSRVSPPKCCNNRRPPYLVDIHVGAEHLNCDPQACASGPQTQNCLIDLRPDAVRTNDKLVNWGHLSLYSVLFSKPKIIGRPKGCLNFQSNHFST